MEVLKLFLSPSSEALDLKKKIQEEFQLEFEILSNASKVQEGFMVSEYGKKDSGKVSIFNPRIACSLHMYTHFLRTSHFSINPLFAHTD